MNSSGSAPKRDLGLLRRRRLKLFKKANLTGVPIGADWNPAYLAIPEQLEVFSSDLVGPLVGAYPQVTSPRDSPIIERQGRQTWNCSTKY